MSDDQQRVVVTGMGVVSPLGVGVEAFHRGLAEGRDGLSDAKFPWDTGYKKLRIGRAPDLDETEWRTDDESVGRASKLAFAASSEALTSARLDMSSRLARRYGFVVGTALGDADELERDLRSRESQPRGEVTGLGLGQLRDNVARHLGFDGPNHLIANTCSAGNHAIAWSSDILKRGEADVMLAIGADTVGYVDILGFCRLLLQAPEYCQPFDRNRKGTILSEGGGALVLETLASAQRRGATPLAEIAGYGCSCDAAGPFASKVDDIRGMKVAFNRALRVAGIKPDQIEHVSAHGSGTKLNDRKETFFLKEMLGAHAKDVPISGIKSMLGHAQGAASMFEAIASVLTLNKGLLYPTIHYETPDPNCDLDYVPNESREADVDTILSNSFGVGGNNALVLFRSCNA